MSRPVPRSLRAVIRAAARTPRELSGAGLASRDMLCHSICHMLAYHALRAAGGYGFAADGRRFYFTLGSHEADVWVLHLNRQ